MHRFNNGAPLLLDHRAVNEKHIGVIESAELGNGKGRAVARLGTAQKSADALTDIRDGILHSVSVGYLIHRVTLEEESDDAPPVYRITDWEPLEASLVAVPADTTVGIGRGYQLTTPKPERKAMQTQPQTPETPETPEPEARVELSADHAVEQAREAELGRMRDIGAIRHMYRNNPAVVRLADKALETGMSLDAFRAEAIPLFRATPIPKQDAPVTEIGMSRGEIANFSMVNAVRALIAHKTEGRNPETLAPFEFECSRAVAQELDRESRGFFVPWDVQRGGNWRPPYGGSRTAPMDVTENVHLVATEHLASSFIDMLYERSTVLRLGAMVLPGLVGNVSIPGFASGMTWGWVDEDGDSGDTEPVTKAVALSPHTVTGSVPITRRLIKQSSPAIEMLLRMHMINGSGEAIDQGALNGSGSNGQPTGIIGTTGLNTSTISSAGAPTHTELVAFETALAVDKALFGPLNYVMTPAVRQHCKVTTLDTGSGLFLEERGLVNGYPNNFTTHMPDNGILFGNFQMVFIGMWGVLDINVDAATRAVKGGLVLRAFQDVDVGVAQPVAFCKNA
jgi:HK97 family phage major capsid protein